MEKGSRPSRTMSRAPSGRGSGSLVCDPSGARVRSPRGAPANMILRARAVAVTRDMVAEVGPTGVIRQISGATKRCGPRLGRGCSAVSVPDQSGSTGAGGRAQGATRRGHGGDW